MVTTQLYLKVRHCWVYNVLNVYTPHVSILRNTLDKKRGVVIDIVALGDVKEVEVDSLIKDIKSSKYVIDVDVLLKTRDRLILKVVTKACPLYPILSYETDAFVKEEVFPNGDIVYTMKTRGSKRVDTVLNRLRREIPDVVVKGIKVYKKKPIVSDHQENIVRLALELGYYDVPKKITLKKLSELTNLSTSTLNEVLRRAEKNIIKKYFEEMKKRI